MATASGDPRLMRKVELDAQVAKLLQEERDHINQQITIQRELEHLPRKIEQATAKLAKHQADKNGAISTTGNKFTIKLRTYDGTTLQLNKRIVAGEIINTYARNLQTNKQYGAFPLGHFANFELLIHHDIVGCTLQLVKNATYNIPIKQTPMATISALEHCVNNGIDKELKQIENQLQKLKQAFTELSSQKQKPFPNLTQLKTLIAEQTTLDKELGIHK
jgi:hypothetical protein